MINCRLSNPTMGTSTLVTLRSVCIVLLYVWSGAAGELEEYYTREFAVHVTGGIDIADQLAARHGYINHGEIEPVNDHYLFSHERVSKRSAAASTGQHMDLSDEPQVEWFEQQIAKTRVKRASRALHNFTDPMWAKQWYLNGNSTSSNGLGGSMNVQGAWDQGYTGEGVVLTILDDGLEYTHEDIALKYDPAASWDYVSRDADPMPRYVKYGAEENMHGTRCAGEIVMQPNNGKCGVGIAYSAQIGGIRMLDGGVTDQMEAQSLGFMPQHVDIYSSSWGPDDGGYTVEGPAYLAKRALESGATKGRGGKGSIFIWASGNGGLDNDDCNADGYANSIYTLVVSSTTENQDRPFYSEHCAASLATTFSSGNRDQKKVLSTDLGDKCTEGFTGTSASAPIAAGICALALEANGNLTWRDLQYLVVVTAKRHQLTGEWTTNGAGREVSHWFGYGLLDAGAMVERAQHWEPLPPLQTCSVMAENVSPRKILNRFLEQPNIFVSNLEVNDCSGRDDQPIRYLEHVQLTMSLSAYRRGNVVVKLTSPSGTTSTMLSKRRRDGNRRGFNRWTLMSVHFWGENPEGTWTLHIGDGSANYLRVSMVRLTLRGTTSLPESLQTPPAVETEEVPAPRGAIQAAILGIQSPNNQQHQPGSEVKRRESRAVGDGDSTSSWSWWDSSWWWSSSDWESFDDCHEECLYGCSGPAATECYKCRHYKDRLTMECVANCPDGQFAPPELHIRCGKCSSHCHTCSGPSPTNCLSCPGEKYLSDENKCVHTCDHGYYADPFFKMCRQCAPLCKQCMGNEDQCTECIQGAVLRGSQCITRCMDSEYLDGNQCKACDVSCFSCRGGSERDCTACFTDYVHKDMMCVPPQQCGVGYYIAGSYDAGGRQCLRCHSTCKTCQGPSFTDCQTCHSGSFFVGGACLQTCENGRFLGTDGACHPCGDGCMVCSGEDQCIQCEASRVLTAGDQDGTMECREGCPLGKYQMEGECFDCHNTCQTCVAGGIIDCTSCIEPQGGSKRYLLEGACVSYCPLGYFKNDQENTCGECDEACLTCTGLHNGECLTCVGGLRLEDNTCIEDNKCDADNCDTCLPGKPSDCQRCLEGYYLEGTACRLTCPDGKLPVPATRSCGLCHPTCKTCENESDYCTSCDHDYYYYEMESLCLADCPDDTYVDESLKQCKECHEKCWTCSGDGPEHCTSCYEVTEFLSGSACVERCPAGEYGDEYTGTCRSCHPSCVTCGGPGDHECITCANHFQLDGGFCRSACPGNSYTDGSGNCQNCDESCQTCTGPANTNCLSCNYYKFLNANNKCVTDCPQHYYPDYESNVCRDCHSSCKTCLDAGAEDCIECSEDTYMLLRNGQLCVDVCPEGFYESTELGFRDCRQCSIECRSCNGTYLNCVSCDDDTYLYQGRCFSSCPSGFYEDPETNHCLQQDQLCPLYCNKCDDWGDCTECFVGYVEYFGECVHEEDLACHRDQYIIAFNSDGSANCGSCDSSCETCLGGAVTDCVKCREGFMFQGSMCVAECAPGTYKDDVFKVCYDCHPTCQTCDKGSPLDCTSCQDGMSLSGVTHGECRFSCPDGMFPDTGSMCAQCFDSRCVTCVGPQQADCTTCELGFFRNETGECVGDCPRGTYEYLLEGTQEGSECRPCHSSCLNCVGPGSKQCSSCSTDMVHLSGQCLWACDSGYYPDSVGACQRCDPSCQTCDGATLKNCTSCPVNQVLLKGVCEDSCEDGYYVVLTDGVPTCMRCDTSCRKCVDYGPFDCVECYDNYELEQGVCYNRCGSGNYFYREDRKNKAAHTCGACHRNCAECFGPGPDQCIDCHPTFFLERASRNETRCIPCCNDADGEECCELCDNEDNKCTRAYVHPPTVAGQQVNHVGTIVFAVLLVVLLFFLVFGLLQARSKGKLCWGHRYAHVPAYSYSKDSKYVTLGKPTDDYDYEEDIYGDVSDEDEEDMEEPDTFQTMGAPYRSLDKNGVIDHL